MCFGGGGGKSASEMYKEQKVDYGALPSLSMGEKGEERKQTFEDVEKPKERYGMQRRSLLNPYG